MVFNYMFHQTNYLHFFACFTKACSGKPVPEEIEEGIQQALKNCLRPEIKECLQSSNLAFSSEIFSLIAQKIFLGWRGFQRFLMGVPSIFLTFWAWFSK